MPHLTHTIESDLIKDTMKLKGVKVIKLSIASNNVTLQLCAYWTHWIVQNNETNKGSTTTGQPQPASGNLILEIEPPNSTTASVQTLKILVVRLVTFTDWLTRYSSCRGGLGSGLVGWFSLAGFIRIPHNSTLAFSTTSKSNQWRNMGRNSVESGVKYNLEFNRIEMCPNLTYSSSTSDRQNNMMSYVCMYGRGEKPVSEEWSWVIM